MNNKNIKMQFAEILFYWLPSYLTKKGNKLC